MLFPLKRSKRITETKYSRAGSLGCKLTGYVPSLPSKDISALSFLNSCKSGTGFQAVISDTKHGAQYLRVQQGREPSAIFVFLISRPFQGTQTISKNMAKELKKGSLWLSTPVTHIEQCAETGIWTVRSVNKAVFLAKKFILSTATPLYNKIQFTLPLPADKQSLAQERILGYYSKMIFVFEKPWWRTAGLSGETKAQDVGPILFSVDTSVPTDNRQSAALLLVGAV